MRYTEKDISDTINDIRTKQGGSKIELALNYQADTEKLIKIIDALEAENCKLKSNSINVPGLDKDKYVQFFCDMHEMIVDRGLMPGYHGTAMG